ncbi:MAG: DUF4250 domain-containing protein [Clostridia bacterium]|nr:DUF4250 domain-containing protein [Clostridia bacterium]
MDLPQDDFILLSFINTKLRDEYSSLDELCDSLDISSETILSRLENLGYTYDEEKNAFVR